MSDKCSEALRRARYLVAAGKDEAAKLAYLDVLRTDPTDCEALTELASLAHASGHISAASSAYGQAVRYHPYSLVARVELANLLYEGGDLAAARQHYAAAIAFAPESPEAHQGLARVLADLGEETADRHWQMGFAGHAVSRRRYRGSGTGIPLLLLVSARGGNIPTRLWIDDRCFAVTAIYADFHDPLLPLPPHALVVNAIGDADLCGQALADAERLTARSTSPVINQPARVRPTGRVCNANRLANVPGVIAAATVATDRMNVSSASALGFPLLLRSPGFHGGQNFILVKSDDRLKEAAASLPGEQLVAIQYFDARGPDEMARKYRVMFIDGIVYPLHLAISTDWKVHYFTADMASKQEFREEERRFLEDMPGVLGSRAMAALAGIQAMLGLDYAGIDFALAADGSVLLFEANATMAIVPPEADPMWDYRRRFTDSALNGAKQMLSRRAGRFGEDTLVRGINKIACS